jgi:hypothetical protein
MVDLEFLDRHLYEILGSYELYLEKRYRGVDGILRCRWDSCTCNFLKNVFFFKLRFFCILMSYVKNNFKKIKNYYFNIFSSNKYFKTVITTSF